MNCSCSCHQNSIASVAELIPPKPITGMFTALATDAIEFLMAGATAIQIGTANFLDPTITIKVRDGINQWLDEHNISDVNDIIGSLNA